MKISFMTFACPEWTLGQVVEAAVRHQYHGIEFRCDANHRHGVEVWTTEADRRQVRARLEAEGLEACCLATSMQFVRDGIVEQAQQRVDLAAQIGCPALRVFCGPLPEGMRLEEAVEKVGLALRQAAEGAEGAGVQFWLETHDTMSRARDAAAAVRKAAHRNVGVNYDNMHPYRRGETLAETFAALGDLVRHTHFHDAVNSPDKVVIKPVGEGEMPIDPMFTQLVASGYDGYLSGEWFHDQYGAEPDAALERYRKDMATLAEKHGVRIR